MAQNRNGEVIEVLVGEEFAITLESNRTTGYQWQLARPLDEAIVRLVGSEYKLPETRRLGAGGKEVWTFKVVGQGQTTIEMVYLRVWEKDVPPIKRATFTLIVK
jgi:inhibitor of cysteine peptidase